MRCVETRTALRHTLRLFAFLVLALTALPGGAQPAPDVASEAAGLIRAQQFDRAISITHNALARSPDSFPLWLVEAIAYSSKGDDAHALHDLDRALQLEPGQRQALQAKAAILSRRHDKAVVPVLEALLRSDPHDTTAQEMLALAKAQAGDCKGALPLFTELGTRIEGHRESLGQQAACLLQTGAPVAALPVLERLLTLAPGDPDTRYNLAVAQLDAGQPRTATETLAPLLQGSKDVDTLMLGADAYEAQGDTPKAVDLMRTAIVADPSRSNSYVRFAELCMSHESYQAGIDMVSAGLSRLPRNPTLYLARGLLYGGLAKYDQAEADFLAAEKYDPQHGTGTYAVGIIDMQRNQPDQALANVRKGLQQYPDDPELLFLLCRVLVEGGAKVGSPEYLEAERSVERATRLKPRLVQAHDLLAKIYQETGRPEEAIAQCRLALAEDPADGQALYRLMRSLRASGRVEESEQVARKVAAQRDQQRSDETDRLRYKIQTGSSATAGKL